MQTLIIYSIMALLFYLSYKLFFKILECLPKLNSKIIDSNSKDILDSKVDFKSNLDSKTKADFALDSKSKIDSTLKLDSKVVSKTSLIQRTLELKDVIFLISSALLILGICAFTFYLGFPGFLIDGDIFKALDLNKQNFAPVITAYVLEILYFIFGKHTYYLFLINLITFYVGIYFLIAGFYLRFRSYFALFLMFPLFIGNIYFSHFVSMNYVAMANMIFCAGSLVLFCILVHPKTRLLKLLYIFIAILLFLAILWRHNAIFSVFPLCFILIYLLLEDRGLSKKAFIKLYAKGIVICVFVCLFVVIVIPKILTTNSLSSPSHHIFLHQIVGTCIKNDDSSCIKNEWYNIEHNWENAKRIYLENPFFSDPMNGIFSSGEINGLFLSWLKVITKYPLNYLEYQSGFFRYMWFESPFKDYRDKHKHSYTYSLILSPKEIQAKVEESNINTLNKFPINEYSISFSKAREKIYTFLYENRIIFGNIVGVSMSFILMIVSLILICFRKYRNNLLLFSFSFSFAAFFSAVFIAGFSPVIYPRYMSPILPLALMSFIGFIAFVCDRLSRKEV